MKRISILLAFCVLLTVSLKAQYDEMSTGEVEKTKQYFPEQGDFGIGIDGTPIFNYLGNAFNGTIDNKLNLGDNTLYFRYFITDNSAIRLNFSLYQDFYKDKFYVRDDAAWLIDENTEKQLEDMRINNSHNFKVKVGYQYFKDFRRVRGFFGADLGYGRDKSKTEYAYGNVMNEVNKTPSTAFSGPNPNSRYLEYNNGAVNSIFAGLFTGAEYYFAPKMCIGGEFGVSYGANFYGQTFYVYETMIVDEKVEYNKAVFPKSKDFSTGSIFPYTYGNIYFMIHF